MSIYEQMNDAMTGAACFYLTPSDPVFVVRIAIAFVRTYQHQNIRSVSSTSSNGGGGSDGYRISIFWSNKSNGSCETDKSEQEREERNKLALNQAQVYRCACVHMNFIFKFIKSKR